MKRLESTERSLQTKGSFIKKRIRRDNKIVRREGSWYLPHFPIVKLDKVTTKVRIVFDCSAKCEGLSLNNIIHAGPKLQNELFDMLVWFRRNPVGLACDIKEMYLQIEIEEKDPPYLRILWRDCENDREPDEI